MKETKQTLFSISFFFSIFQQIWFRWEKKNINVSVGHENWFCDGDKLTIIWGFVPAYNEEIMTARQ